MDSNPCSQNSKFVELLNSQQEMVFGFSQDSVSLSSSQAPVFAFQATTETPAERRERRVKDPVVGNEQRCGTFWKRIAAYFAASPKVSGREGREPTHCKQRWQKINDGVNKFCGAYEAASREKSLGQNENDVLKLAHEIYFNNHNKKFTLEHAWKELRNDQKWCELSCSKAHGNAKRRKCDDSAQSSSSRANETTTAEDDQGSNRPPGVKASKGQGKKKMAEGKPLSEFQTLWSIKKEDLAMKEKTSKMKLLDSLIAKQEPLAEYEESLKKKLINDLLS
ncbi:PREDICTED: glutathione S-transferase T3-like [Brassica oleracea var. oleracea]|uniref:glutathione S-transferase T3-like n=1 Tax=Brassica oleracea var. oleracea TaxID=109376 RepID=UPI0006A6CECC|nr:PREDICTED: glutathione S-transferase T3-like [Brassica oleracea var. oleracea]